MALRNRRWARTQSFILVWCGDEPLELFYNAQSIWVPPVDKVAKIGIGSPYRLPAATSKSGVPLPGTTLVEDIIANNGEGTTVTFQARDFCASLEREQPELWDRGFDITEDPSEVRDLQIAGRPLYEASLDARAREIIDAELARRKALEDAGRPLTAASNEKEVVWAFRHRQKRGVAKPAISTADLFAAASGTYVETAQEAAAAAPAVAPTGKAIIEECEELAITLTKGELMGLLKDDKEQVAFVLQRIALKREQRKADEAAVAEAPA